jgi:hypothetical protein
MRNLQKTNLCGVYTGELQRRLFKKLLNPDGFPNLNGVEQKLPLQNGTLINVKEYQIRNTHGCRTRFTDKEIQCFYRDGKIIAN